MKHKSDRVRPAHILRMCNRFSKIFPDLDFTNIVTIDENQMQTRFENPLLAGCFIRNTGDIFIGLPDIRSDFFYRETFSDVANILLHEVIHRKQHSIDPKSKPHGKLFQKLCLKYGLDPRLEIKHDKGQKLKVKIPYEIGAWKSAAGLITDNYQDIYDRKHISDEVFLASRSIYRRKHSNMRWNDEDEFMDYVDKVYLHQYHQYYPAYRLCDHIVSGYSHKQKRVQHDL